MHGILSIDKEDSHVLDCNVIPLKTLSGTITNDTEILIGQVTIADRHDQYTGNYEVVPNDRDQILNTVDKLLSRNVFVKAIPYYSVSNEHNGETIIIGGNE